MVKSKFRVSDETQLQDGGVEYRVFHESESKRRFEELCGELAPLGLTPLLLGDEEDCRLILRREDARVQEPRSQWSLGIPRTVGLFVLVSIAVFALLEAEIYASYSPGTPLYLVFATYASSVGAILAAHEFGHRFLSWRMRVAPHVTYVVPGIPTVTSFLPVLGSVSTQRQPAVNRDQLFDLMVAGPLAALLVAIVLYSCGQFIAVQSSLPTQGASMVGSFISVGQVSPSVLQRIIDAVLSSFTRSAVSGLQKLSPLEDAATVGFMLTFIGLFPLAYFDGGYLFAAVFGDRASRIATYIGVLTLFVLDTPRYWALAVLVLLLAGGSVDLRLRDNVSRVSKGRKAFLLVLILLAFLSLPVPVNIATFPLG
jgi:membrane-associated protease RseP (regulator of RpoE activity)